MLDVIFFNSVLKQLYLAVGDHGVIEVFETDSLQRLEVISTEKGAHTIGYDTMLMIRNRTMICGTSSKGEENGGVFFESMETGVKPLN